MSTEEQPFLRKDGRKYRRRLTIDEKKQMTVYQHRIWTLDAQGLSHAEILSCMHQEFPELTDPSQPLLVEQWRRPLKIFNTLKFLRAKPDLDPSLPPRPEYMSAFRDSKKEVQRKQRKAVKRQKKELAALQDENERLTRVAEDLARQAEDNPDIRKTIEQLALRDEIRQELRGILFPRQLEVVDAPRMFKCLLCGRRSGKSYLLVVAILLALVDCGSNEHVVFTAISRKKAEEIIWTYLFGFIEKYQLVERLEWTINQSERTIETPTGGRFWMHGLSEERNISKVRGNKYRLFICDEAQSYEDLLSELLDEGVIPALGEARDPRTGERCGQIILAGTPTGVLSGPWFRISTGAADRPGTPEVEKWFIRTWTMRDNPAIDDADSYMKMIQRKNGWDDDSWQFQQEFLARWTPSDSILCFPRFEIVPAKKLPSESTSYYIGIDYGFNPDPTAIIVIGVQRGTRQGRIVYSWAATDMGDDEFATKIASVVQRYNPVAIVGDTAGAGSRAIGLFNSKFGEQLGVHIESAQKSEKLARFSMLAADLRRGAIVIEESLETTSLVMELRELRWKDSTRKTPHPSCPDHLVDALSYCHMEMHHATEDYVQQRIVTPTNDEEAHIEMLQTFEEHRLAHAEHSEGLQDLFGWAD